MEERGLDCVVILGEANLAYLTGYRGPGALLISKNGVKKLLVPLLEAYRAEELVKDVEILPYVSYPAQHCIYDNVLYKRLKEAIVHILKGIGARKVGVDISEGDYDVIVYVKEKLKHIVDISDKLKEMRSIKDPKEIEVITHAIRIAECGLEKSLDLIRDGMSEIEVAGIVEFGMRKAGANGYAFPTIVASGSNAAYPHAVPSNKPIGRHEPIVIDLGALYNNYCSDLTRTLFIGGADPEIKRALEAVIEAQEEAIDIIEPGIKACEVDMKAREVLAKYDLDKYFIHSLGHGIGIEVHEAPTLSSNSDTELKSGMVITIEPGIYIKGKYGIRIEDDVLVTKSGRTILSSMNKLIEL